MDLKVIGALRLDTLVKLAIAPEKEWPKYTQVRFRLFIAQKQGYMCHLEKVTAHPHQTGHSS